MATAASKDQPPPWVLCLDGGSATTVAATARAEAEQHGIVAGSYVLAIRLDEDRFDGAIMQARISGFEPIGRPCSGQIYVSPSSDHGAQIDHLVAQLGEMEDVEGLTPEWISAVFLTGDRALIPAIRRRLTDSHPGVPILEGDDVASMIGIGTTHALAAPPEREPPARASNVAGPVPTPLGAAFRALNADWELEADQPRRRSRVIRRRQLVIFSAAVLAIAGGSSVFSDDAAPSDPSNRSVAAVASAGPSSAATDRRPVVVGKILPDGDSPAQQPVPMVAFDAVLTHLDVKREWDQNIVGPNTDLGDGCGRRAPNLAVMSIRRRFISSTGGEKLASVVNTFTNPVIAQASLMEVERNFGACNHYEWSDNGRWVRMEVLRSQPTPPRHGDASFVVTVGTAEEEARPTSITWYGLVRHDRYITEIEYSVTSEHRRTTGAPAASIAQRDRFERLLRRASDRLEHVIG